MKRALLFRTKISPGYLKQTICIKSKKCLAKYLKSSGLQSKHPLSPPPTVLFGGQGSTGSFQPQAVALVMVLKP
jgi:hypothetical protein